MGRTIALIGSDGSPVAFPYVGEDPAIFGAPPVEYEEEESAAGTVISRVRYTTRDNVLPLLLVADTPDEFDRLSRELLRALNPMSGPSRILVTSSNGEQRELSAYAVAGWEALSLPAPDSAEQTIPIRFKAPDPFWRSVQATESRFEYAQFGTGEGTTPWDPPLPWNPALPWTGVTVAAHLIAPLNNSGDVISWPRIEIKGPASSVELVNHHPSSHEVMFWDNILLEGETLVIDTTPGRRMISVDGSPSFRFMGDGWEWWGLHPGVNDIGIHLESFGSATELSISFHNRWLRA